MWLKRILALVIIVLVVSLIIMRVQQDQSQQAPDVALGGPQTLTGTLVRAELSLTRRGTHVLKIESQDAVYVESNSFNLRNFEDSDVAITGVVEANVGKNLLPVLVVSAIKAIEVPSRDWKVPALQLSLRVPQQWTAKFFDDGVAFSVTGSTVPLLNIHKTGLLSLPIGTPLVVGGERAVQSGSGSVADIFVQHGKMILSVSPGVVLQASDSSSHVLTHILKSLVFQTTQTSSGTVVIPSGSGGTAGSPCGGAAGILCPDGSYCAITDTVLGIGQCRKIGM